MGQEHSKIKDITTNGKPHEKQENGGVNGLALNIPVNDVEIDVSNETAVHQNGELVSMSPPAEVIEPDFEIIEPDSSNAEAPVISESTDSPAQREDAKETKVAKVNLFDKMFKKKTVPPASEVSSQENQKTEVSETKENMTEDQLDTGPPATEPQPEPADIKQDSETFKGPKSLSLDPSPEGGESQDTDKGSDQLEECPEESYAEENPVMNFFKSLVTPIKSSKKETAAPDAAKEQSQREAPPVAAAATTVSTVAHVPEPAATPKGMSIPPPPPPEPPKMETKGDPAAKLVKDPPKEEPKAAPKEPEVSKGRSARDTLSKLFRTKSVQEEPRPVVDAQVTVEEVQVPEIKLEATSMEEVLHVQPKKEEGAEPAEEMQKVDPSKTSTLEAGAKAEPPPAVKEEKKAPSKSSFLSLFKPKATEAKKVGPAPPADTEAAQIVKPKEEPKSCTKSSEAPVDNKSVSVASQGGEDSADIPRKLEKRNSIHLFFKSLSQKRPSTDTGVQTEPVTITAATEKAK